ncbi:MAG: 2-oxo acid dehydrogenase subunit E2 [Propionibacteriaceae bacterium]|nr:2-oxo acid dehydrogenase subunit E2 [Propionibacteriaceae bacterium]
MYEFKLPDPGEGLLEAEIVSWKVAVGDQVAVNDILLEIETAKSLVELPSPFAGTVLAVLVGEGDLVDVGTPIIRIGDPSEITDGTTDEPAETVAEPVEATSGTVTDSAAAPLRQAQGSFGGQGSQTAVSGSVQDSNGDPVEAEKAPAMLVGYGAKPGAVTRRARKRGAAMATPETDQVHESYDTDRPVSRPVDEVAPLHRVDAVPSGETLPPPGEPTGAGEMPRPPLAKPPVRRVARDLGVDLTTIVGTGPGGLITHEDVIAAASGARLDDRPGVDQRVALRGVRREMFRTMTASLSVPQATAWVEVDVTGTVELLDTLRGRREFHGLRVSPLLVVAKAACLAIARNPEINSSFDEKREEIVIRGDVNLGIAAATPRGLIVPNIKRANRLGLRELAEALNQMVDLAKQGKAQPADFANGSFTITNVGVFGIDGGTPILNPGEAAILCVGTVARRPWVVIRDGEEQVEPRSVCTLALTFDHRLVDGETGSKFLADVAAILEDPGLALLF